MPLPIDPIIAWHDLRNRVDMDFYTNNVEEEVVEFVYLSSLGPAAVTIIHPDGDTGFPAIIRLTGDWTTPVEVDIQWVADVSLGGGAVFTPTFASNPVKCAEEIAEFLNGNPVVNASAVGSAVHIKARHAGVGDSFLSVLSATPIYVPPA